MESKKIKMTEGVQPKIPEIIKIKKNDIGFINYKPEKIPDYDKIINVVKGETAFERNDLSKRKKKFDKIAKLLEKFINMVKDVINTDMSFVNDYFDYNPNNSKHRKLFNKLKKIHKNQVKCDGLNKTIATSGIFSSTFETEEVKDITDILKRITSEIDNCFKILNDLATEHATSAKYNLNISKESGKTGDILQDSGLKEAQSKQPSELTNLTPFSNPSPNQPYTLNKPPNQTPNQTPNRPGTTSIFYGGYYTKRLKYNSKKLNRKKTIKQNKKK